MRQEVNILVVDDASANLFALEKILETEGYHVISVKSGQEALEKLQQEQDIAVILMDVHMPEMDGFETTQKIKQLEKSRHIPIIFVSAAFIDDDSVFHGYEVGGFDYLTKPFSAKLLRSKVRVFVNLFKKEKQILEISNKLRQLEQRVKKTEDQIATLEENRKQLLSQVVKFSFHNSELSQSHAKMLKRYEQMENENELLQKQLSEFLKDLNTANQSIAVLQGQLPK